jgi:hypothetical protein
MRNNVANEVAGRANEEECAKPQGRAVHYRPDGKIAFPARF